MPLGQETNVKKMIPNKSNEYNMQIVQYQLNGLQLIFLKGGGGREGGWSYCKIYDIHFIVDLIHDGAICILYIFRQNT